MYTELIVGAKLKQETPVEVIHILSFMLGENTPCPPLDVSREFDHKFFKTERWRFMLSCSSYYFGFPKSTSVFKLDEINGSYVISTRSSFKNYDNELELFIDWFRKYVDCGSGQHDIFAMSIYEEEREYTFYK